MNLNNLIFILLSVFSLCCLPVLSHAQSTQTSDVPNTHADTTSEGPTEPSPLSIAWENASFSQKAWGLIVAIPTFIVTLFIGLSIGAIVRRWIWNKGQQVEYSFKSGCAQILSAWLLPLIVAFVLAYSALEWALGVST